MHPDYSDITSRLGEPRWFDGGAVPRYCDFTPNACRPYDRIVALLEVRCQLCPKRFLVATELDSAAESAPGFGLTDLDGEDHWDRARSLHFGDPPRHGDCAGESANCVPVRVIEFWRRVAPLAGWKRDAAHEVLLDPWGERSPPPGERR